MLSTEHGGLLAARSTAQSEVLTRMTIFLTLVWGGLITIGLLGQASDFLRVRSASHLLGSSSHLVFVVDACVFGFVCRSDRRLRRWCDRLGDQARA